MNTSSGTPWRFTAPETFDHAFYTGRYKDLSGHDYFAAMEHYKLHGAAEGRIASPLAERPAFLTLADGAGSILEIGPGHKPSFTGEHVRYFDILDADELRQRAITQTEESPDGVPEKIHYLRKDVALADIPDRFDIVFTSHSIEHQPDLISHINACHGLLNPGGAMMAIVPDRRYTFDASIAPSTIGEVLEAYWTKRTQHRLADIIDAYAHSTHNDPVQHWQDGPVTRLKVDGERLDRGYKTVEEGRFIDVHAWRVSCFEMADYMRHLRRLGLIRFEHCDVFPTPLNSNEFCMVMY
ncbi:MAG: class I SAM-dependent methyltransferase [Caulobacterales bacterium]|uniref:class I SAM-dependent methyltransferase n=1 Tax=Glycocaulis sp. TaxID=1969725 RepID=UPI003FA16D1A